MRTYVAVLGCLILLVFPTTRVQAVSIDELTAQLNVLMQRLAELRQQAQAGNPSQPVPAASCPDIGRRLSRGAKGPDVAALQRYLTGTGDYTYGEVTSFFGPATEDAVKKFQCRELSICAGNPQSTGYGAVGPATLARIRAQCAAGTMSSAPSAAAGSYADDMATHADDAGGSRTPNLQAPSVDQEFDSIDSQIGDLLNNL